MIQTTPKKKITSDSAAAEVIHGILMSMDEHELDKEHFWVIGLNTKHHIIYVDLVTIGTLDASLVHPREVFRIAVSRSCAAIILAHNHPSSDCTPSSQDVEVTRRLVAAGNVLGIEVLDHVIVASDRTCHTSIRQTNSEAFK